MFRPLRRIVPHAAACFALAAAILAASPARAQESVRTIPGEVLVKYRPAARAADRAAVRAQVRARPFRSFDFIRVEHLQLEEITAEQAIARLRSHPLVEYIEPNFEVHALVVPNDPMFSQLYGMQNTGQTGGTPGADIRATLAWGLFTGDPNLKIGVIDTGVDYNHPDLAANIWTNPGEIPGNGVDDDANGYVDDVHGYDFANKDGNPFDDHGHGTHVSGTIAAVGNNGVGVVGVNWNAKVVAIKFLNASGSGSTAGAIAAIQYAITVGVRVTNNSWGGGPFSQALLDAINASGAAGQLFVAAAGNRGSNNDFSPAYPASYDTPYIVAVAASDHNDALARFSNFGPTSVDLAAPGVSIVSTLPGGGYGTASGTSMASPHVAGAVAFVLGRFPGLPALSAKSLILNGVDPRPAFTGMVLTGGRLNLFQPILEPDSIPPGPVTDLAAGESGSNTVRLTWTAPGDDGSTGRAVRYDIRYSTAPITEAGFAGATPAPGPDPQTAGSPESVEVAGLAFSTTYYFALKAFDEFDNPDPISNVASATTRGIPDLTATPISFFQELLTGATATQTLTLANDGEGTLDFTIPAPELQLAQPVPHEFLPLAKGQDDPRQGDPVTAGSGGTDAFGYRWTDSNEPGGPVFQWVDITGVGQRLTLSGDDATTAPIDMGMSFPFYGNTFTSVRVSTNGFLSFTDPGAPYANQPLPNVGAPADLVAPMWDDLDFGGSELAWVHGDSSRFIISWVGVPHYGGGGPYTFQTILHPNGDIVFQYQSLAPPTNSATVGIQDSTRTIGLQVAFDATYLQNGLAVRIRRLPEWLAVQPRSGRIAAGQSMEVQLHYNALGLGSGDYDDSVRVLSNDPDESPTVLPVRLHVIGTPDLAVNPASLDFGTLFVGLTRDLTVELRNVGSDALTISSASVTGVGFSLVGGGFPVTVPLGGAVTRTLRFAPPAPCAPCTGALSLASNDPDENPFVVPLTGVGLPPPDIAVTPMQLEEALLEGQSSAQRLLIANQGSYPLDVRLELQTLATSAAGAVAHQVSPPAELSADELAGLRERYGVFATGGGGTPAPAPLGARAASPAVLAPGEHPNAVTIFFDDMEGGAGGWTHYPTHANSIDLWSQTTQRASSGTTSWRVSQHGFEGSDALQTPAIDLGGYGHATLSFYHWCNFDDCSGSPSFGPDGGIVEVAEVGTSTWQQVFPDSGYPYVLDDVCYNPLAYRQAYSHDSPGDSSFVTDVFDLTPFAGKRIYIRFHAGWDCGNCELNEGWFIDDVRVFSESPRWVQVTPAEGTVQPQDVLEVVVTYDASDLPPGEHQAQLLISSNDPDEPQLTVPIRLLVADVSAVLDVDPNTVNLGQRGQWLTCYLEFSGGLDPAAVDVASLRFNHQVPADPSRSALGDHDGDGIPDLMIKFDFEAARSTLSAGEQVRMIVTGLVGGAGRLLGVDVRRVIGPQLLAPNGNGLVVAQGEFVIRWDVPDTWQPDHADLYYSRDGGVSWTLIAAGVQGTSYVWNVPGVNTRHALVRVDVYDAQGPLASDVSDGEFEIQAVPTAVGEAPPATSGLALYNAPNPFTAGTGTSILFALPTPGMVELSVYNAAGRRVRVLMNGWLPAGRQQVRWDGRDQHGASLGSGLYFGRLRTPGLEATRRMALIR